MAGNEIESVAYEQERIEERTREREREREILEE